MAILKYIFPFLLIFQFNLNAKESYQFILDDFKSPITTDAAWITGAGATFTFMTYLTQKDIDYKERKSFKDSQPIGNLGFIGNYIGYGALNFSYLFYQYYDYQVNGNTLALKRADHMFRATSATFLVTQSLKTVIKERRPGFSDDSQSFPSGHSSASFAFATVIALQHGWVYGGLAHGLAAFIATSRINDDFHYLHDVVFGMTIGMSYGFGVYYNMENSSDGFWTLVPIGSKGLGFVTGTTF